MAYDYLDQNVVATALIQPFDNDSFYNPVPLGHTGYAADWRYYSNGIEESLGYGLDPYGNSPYGITRPFASWYTEFSSNPSPYRDFQAAFPTVGIVLLSPTVLTILDGGTPTNNAANLALWMQFLLNDGYALTNNYDGSLQGFLPSALSYANGVISVTYTPDSGNIVGGSPIGANSRMVVTIDFTKDSAYLDVALDSWKPGNIAYTLNQYIFDTNGNAQQVTTPGTGGNLQPVWNPNVGGTTSAVPTGGTAVWTNRG